MAEKEGQQHPIGIYLWIWGLLFVFSAGSYAVDWFQFQGLMRWSLIIFFMMLKAGFIVAIFMHMFWERLAILYAVLLPCIAIRSSCREALPKVFRVPSAPPLNCTFTTALISTSFPA